jgi:hypothetical protein
MRYVRLAIHALCLAGAWAVFSVTLGHEPRMAKFGAVTSGIGAAFAAMAVALLLCAPRMRRDPHIPA